MKILKSYCASPSVKHGLYGFDFAAFTCDKCCVDLRRFRVPRPEQHKIQRHIPWSAQALSQCSSPGHGHGNPWRSMSCRKVSRRSRTIHVKYAYITNMHPGKNRLFASFCSLLHYWCRNIRSTGMKQSCCRVDRVNPQSLSSCMQSL